MNRRRVVGLLLLLGSPGVMTGVSLTLFFATSPIWVRVPWPISDLIAFVPWGAAAVGSALGGYLATPRSAGRDARILCAGTGLLFGAGVFLAVMVKADRLVPWF